MMILQPSSQTTWIQILAALESLVVRFLTKRFIWEYDPTLENVSAMYYACVNDHYTWLMAESTYRHQATIDDEVVTMEILDTAGQEDTIQREGHMRWGEGFVLVYDITDRGSFEEVLPLKNILDEIKKPKNVTLILVGNKADLDHSRQVSTEEGEKLATELACAFYECSACTGEGNITEIFYELCREVRRRRMVQGKTRRRSSTTHVKQAINKMLTKISS
ncbi:ras-related and estrogen-regulated growth inhibitor isoform X2 [Hippopotamus amphibius kiboko]|uniref:ras-related and estrogen-regulated growth inhibitor isoform X2 n=1 Tax=Hippopotamus amphibius kiboko TaxID=575201 RepID=UPI0025992BE1|nr:ras-related and estrogen-regulated growth inhibitor isoform X2 [Hippopotamus amphibius kiboko]